MATSCELQEAVYQAGTAPGIDKVAGKITGVKILGRESPNGGGRIYSDAALREAAVCYDGLGVNLNHPDRSTPGKERRVEDGIGWLENIQVRDDGVYGDMAVILKHPYSEAIMEAAERRPDRFGLSHNARGGTSRKGDKTIVESITSVRSVDLVQNPATNKSLFESEDPVSDQKHTLKSLIEALPTKSVQRKALSDLLEEEMFPMAGPDMPVDMAVAPEGESLDADTAAKAAFEAVILGIFRDDKLTWKETQTKIKEAIDALAKMSGGDPASETPEEPAEAEGDVAAMESIQEEVKQLKAELAQQKAVSADKDATLQARELLESKCITIKPERVSVIKSITDKAARTELLESWAKADGPKPKPAAPRPAASPSAVNLTESLPANYQPPKTAKEMAASYR